MALSNRFLFFPRFYAIKAPMDKKAVTFRIDPNIIKRLKYLALDYDKTLTDLFLEAIRDLLAVPYDDPAQPGAPPDRRVSPDDALLLDPGSIRSSEGVRVEIGEAGRMQVHVQILGEGTHWLPGTLGARKEHPPDVIGASRQAPPGWITEVKVIRERGSVEQCHRSRVGASRRDIGGRCVEHGQLDHAIVLECDSL